MIPNVLATRYASPQMTDIWSARNKIVAERQLWLAVLQAQADLGVEVPDGVLEDYRAVVDQVDLASIAARERITRHDVKARIDEFSALAGHEHIHKGLTSRDLTENVEQMQVRQSLLLVRDKTVALLARLAWLAAEHEDLALTGRSHNVAAQTTTLGKRFASAADELMVGYERLRHLIADYPLRDQGSGGHRTGHAGPARQRGRVDRARTTRRGSPGLRTGAHFRRADLPEVPGPRRRRCAGPVGSSAVESGDHHPADGRA